MKILIRLSYDGTKYSGWQIQPNADTVQERIEKAVSQLTGEKVKVTGSGRTDAGVHAACQVAHFETGSKIPPEKFKYALNAILPDDIRITKSMEIDDSFHAVKSAKKKTYVYTLITEDNPLLSRYAYFFDRKIDFRAIKAATKLFVGTHDFKGFSAAGGSAKTSVRTIYSLKVKKVKNKITFTVTGNGFLYKMVRMIVGALICVGVNKMSCCDIKQALISGNKPNISLTLPAKGLRLENVYYPFYKK